MKESTMKYLKEHIAEEWMNRKRLNNQKTLVTDCSRSDKKPERASHTYSLNHSAEVIIRVVFGILIVYFVLLSGASTAALEFRQDEHINLIEDSALKNCVVAGCFFGTLLLLRVCSLKYNWKYEETTIQAVEKAVLYVIAGGCVIFILSSQRMARADQYAVVNTANEWIEHDFSSLGPSGYLGIYPSQAGIVLLFYGVSWIFGSYNYIAFQFFNVIALLVSVKTLADVLTDSTGNPLYGLCVCIAAGLFIPCQLYVGFIYGTMLGLMFCLLSFRLAVKFIRTNCIKYAFFSVFAMLFAVIIKPNYLIFWLGLCAFIALSILKDFHYCKLAFLLVMIAVIMMNGNLIDMLVHSVTGQHLGPGISKWSWVAMGLMENDELYDGWWNHYNTDTYFAYGMDPVRQKKHNLYDIVERINFFKNHPEYTLRFFAGKNASQWNNPDFESLWINQVMPEDEVLHSPRWINRLLSPLVAAKITYYLNYIHFLILFGSCLNLISPKKTKTDYFYMITFIGGTVFYTVWEAKGQYTFPFFMMLIPMAVEGYGDTAFLFADYFHKGQKKTNKRPLQFRAGFVLLLIAAIIIVDNCKATFFSDLFNRNEDTDAYHQYLAMSENEKTRYGEDSISPHDDQSPQIGSLDETAD